MNQPCQRTGCYSKTNCNPADCTNPWCDSERRNRSSTTHKLKPEVTAALRNIARWRQRNPEPEYSHNFPGVFWRYGHWHARTFYADKFHTIAVYPGTPAGELDAAAYINARCEPAPQPTYDLRTYQLSTQ